MKKLLAILAVLVLAGGVLFVSYQQGWISPPELTLELRAVTPGGEPLYGVQVEALDRVQGQTDTNGSLSFQFTRGVGEEIQVLAAVDRPGFRFKPWQERVVVRKWDRARPETMRYRLEAVLEPLSISTQIEVRAEEAPVAGASVEMDGNSLGATDANGRVSVDLGTETSRSAKISVRLKGYQPWEEAATLRAGNPLNVRLSKLGVVYGSVLAAYESMGRLVPVAGAEVSLGGKSLGKTDDSGLLRFEAPEQQSSLQVKKTGFLPDPVKATVPARSRGRVVAPLFPEEAPFYRLVVLPPKSARPGDKDVDSALPEIEDRLADYLFSYKCFEKTDSATFQEAMSAAGISEEKLLSKGWAGTPLDALADAVVLAQTTKDDQLIVSVEVISAKGERLGAFAERGRRSRVRSICEDVAQKIKEIFPFEGHVRGDERGLLLTSLGAGLDREVRKGDAVAIFRWDFRVPPQLASLGRAVVASADDQSSRLELKSKDQKIVAGDKVVLLPRNKEAAFNAAVAFTVKAGKEGSEQPFPDVNVYRDGTWVGETSEEGELRVPVASGESYEFLFVRGSIKPYRESLRVDQSLMPKTVLLPQTVSRLRMESDPSGARVNLDGKPVGVTPLDIEVAMGFLHVTADAGGDLRVFDQVLEITSPEEDFTGRRRIVFRKDFLKQGEALLAKGDVDGAIALLSQIGPDHPDFSAAHNRLGSIYLDNRKQPAKAIAEFEKVLERPENQQLVDKRFTVTFLNLGRAYYLLGTADGSKRAIPLLLRALENKRFFPRERYERASHDTLYFLALASHKLYYASPSERRLHDTERRWRDYFDFFPEELQQDQDVQRARTGAEHFYEEIKRKLTEGGS